MTCIVGYVKKGKVTIGGDSAGVAGLEISIRKDTKVFETGPFIMGFTSSFRMGQLLMSSDFKPPHQKKNQTDYDFMITTFIDAVRDCYKKGGYLQKYSEGDEKGGTLLVGYKGELYMVEDDFQVAMHHDEYFAVGCGESYAKGAIFALGNDKNLDPKEKITIGLESASYFSGGVAPPFNFVEMTKEESEEEASKIEKPKKKKKKTKKK